MLTVYLFYLYTGRVERGAERREYEKVEICAGVVAGAGGLFLFFIFFGRGCGAVWCALAREYGNLPRIRVSFCSFAAAAREVAERCGGFFAALEVFSVSV
jgi:hypothetical protein